MAPILGYILQQILNGLVLGSMYALLAIGMTIVYGILRLINFAHGAFIMLGAFAVYFLFNIYHVPLLGSIILAVIIGGFLGVLYDVVGFRKVKGKEELALLITSLGIYIFIENAAKLVFSPQSYAFKVPSIFYNRFGFYGVTISVIDIITILSSIVITLSFELFIRRTKLGIAMRATAENIEAAKMMGIDVERIILFAFVSGTAIAALTGFMWGAKYSSIQYNIGFMIGVKAFVAIVIGGLGSVLGSMLGGYILGISEMLSVGLLPPGLSSYRNAVVFTLLIIMLVFRPYGILGEKEVVKV